MVWNKEKLKHRPIKNQTIPSRKLMYNITILIYPILATRPNLLWSSFFSFQSQFPEQVRPVGELLPCIEKSSDTKNMDSTLPATRKEFSTFIYHQADSQGLVSVLLIAAMIIPRNIMVSTFMEDTSTLPHTNLDSRLLATCSFSIRKFYQYFNFI